MRLRSLVVSLIVVIFKDENSTCSYEINFIFLMFMKLWTTVGYVQSAM